MGIDIRTKFLILFRYDCCSFLKTPAFLMTHIHRSFAAALFVIEKQNFPLEFSVRSGEISGGNGILNQLNGSVVLRLPASGRDCDPRHMLPI